MNIYFKCIFKQNCLENKVVSNDEIMTTTTNYKQPIQ